jgi:hypothetical protein
MLPLENRAALLKIVCDCMQKHNPNCANIHDMCNHEGECRFAQDMVAEMMDKDVVVQKHGHLKHCPRENFALCSVCSEEIYLGSYHQFAHNGCPNCLAVLDEPAEWEEDNYA